jgi:DNA recombination protein RmuC
VTEALSALAGLALGVLSACLWFAGRIRELNARIAEKEGRLGVLEADLADARLRHVAASEEAARLSERLTAEQRVGQEKLALLEDARSKLADAFKALSADALKASSESFLQLAQESLSRFQEGAKLDLEARGKAITDLAQPIRERLEKFDGKLDEIEKSRIGAYHALSQSVDDLLKVHLPQLHRETAILVRALRQPHTRGRWGETQLRRVVELAGMLEHCDFEEQVTQATDGGRLRPDMIVHLPGSRRVVIDVKVPLDAYLSAVEAESEETRRRLLGQHAAQVRAHVASLSARAYFEQFDPTPEFVVMFVPGEAFFSAALTEDPTLIEHAAEQRVIPASPTTLIALLKAVAYGWRQEALARNAAQVAALGKDLYERISKLAEHWSRLGERLDQAVEAYNDAVGALESRVLPAARRFQELKVVGDSREIEGLGPVAKEARVLTAEEMTGLKSSDEGR